MTSSKAVLQSWDFPSPKNHFYRYSWGMAQRGEQGQTAAALLPLLGLKDGVSSGRAVSVPLFKGFGCLAAIPPVTFLVCLGATSVPILIMNTEGTGPSHLGARGKCSGLLLGDLKDTVTEREPSPVRQSEVQEEGLPPSRKNAQERVSLAPGAGFDPCERERAKHGAEAAPAPTAPPTASLPRLKSPFSITLKLSLPRLHVGAFPLALSTPPSPGSQAGSTTCSLRAWHRTEHPRPARQWLSWGSGAAPGMGSNE